MKPTAPIRRINAAVLNWQDTAAVLLWKLAAGHPVTILESDMKEILEHYPDGPVVHTHATETSIVLRMLTKEQARAEGLTRE